MPNLISIKSQDMRYEKIHFLKKGGILPLKRKSRAVSNTVFVVGIAIAILLSVLVSTFISRQFTVGPQGPIGDKGGKVSTSQ